MKELIATTLGEELRQLRKKQGLSQQELSFRTDIDRSFLSQLENGKQLPTIHTLFRLAEALEVNPSVIISNVEKAVKQQS